MSVVQLGAEPLRHGLERYWSTARRHEEEQISLSGCVVACEQVKMRRHELCANGEGTTANCTPETLTCRECSLCMLVSQLPW